GWEPLTHPEGSLFFYHPYKRVFTDADVRDPETAIKLGKAVEKVYEEARDANIVLHPSVELALELIVKDGAESWGYYFADHERRVIFWFKDHKSHSLMRRVRGVKRKSHIKYALEAQYWNHIELFPYKRFLPEDVVVELKELLIHAQADHILFETSLVPFTADQVTSMLGLIDPLMSESFPDAMLTRNASTLHGSQVRQSRTVGCLFLICMSISARWMKIFCNAKFKNFCGQPGARLDIDRSLYRKSGNQPPPFSFSVMNVFLFNVPRSQWRSVNRIWVDKAIIWPRWRKFRDRLTTEWNGYALFSTVMLAVNISFLAVPSVTSQSFVTDLAYMSAVFTIGSLVSTLFLVGQVNDSLRGTTEEVAYYMQDMPRSMLGLEGLALMLSLPLGLLSWGCV
ncbi:hypothetical protein DEU56DRAFT_707667, partial [Suillus clintonianus]|uniref:uncharacterized protein n=1 Tax=Suillus clintonianus TaxID=1904413 RepID=UPI001B883A91